VKTVLLLHAGIADSRMWRPQVETLESAGYRVLAPDLRGFGERRLDPVPFLHRRDVEAVLDGPVAIVGSSLGGRVALELALARPELVERLVLIAPGLPGWEWAEERGAVREMVIRSYALQRDGWGEGAREDGVLEVAGRLGEIRCPTLVIAGARLVTVPGAAHLPSLECPGGVNPLLLAFLGEP
jgi:pimeloyl-ACP methyl ester carboxylesterase